MTSKDSVSFFDPDSDNSTIDPKSDINIENDYNNEQEEIPLCDSCQNIILVRYKEHNKLICPSCLTIYDPKWEYIQIQDQETTLDDLSSKGEMTFVNEDEKLKQRTTLNRQNATIEDNLDYVKKEFEKYRKMEIIKAGYNNNSLRENHKRDKREN